MWPFSMFQNRDFEKSKTVLVVDDGEIDRMLAVRSLEKVGYNILEAASGKKAIDVASQEVPDLILLDFVMPDMKGPEVCEILKSEPKTKDIPVIFLTSMDTPYSIIDGFDKGADNYLTKPIKPREIVYQVTLMLKDIERHRNLSTQKEVN